VKKSEISRVYIEDLQRITQLPPSQCGIGNACLRWCFAYALSMADGSDTMLTASALADVATLTSSIKTFAGGHGGARAVIEYVGRRGARVVLVGRTANGQMNSRAARMWRARLASPPRIGGQRVGAGTPGADASKQRSLAVDGP